MRTDLVCLAGTAVLATCSLAFAQGAVEKEAVVKEAVEKETGPLVTIEVDIIEVSPKTERLGRIAADDSAFIAKLRELEKADKLPGLTRLRLSTLGGTKGMTQLGGESPVVTGRTIRGRDAPGGGFGGQSPVTIQFRNHGTILQATPRVEAGGAIQVQMDLSRSGLRSETAAPAGTSPDGGAPAAEPQIPAGTTTLTMESTLRIKDGQTVVAQGFESLSEKEATQTIVLVTARIETDDGQQQSRAELKDVLKIFRLQHANATSSCVKRGTHPPLAVSRVP